MMTKTTFYNYKLFQSNTGLDRISGLVMNCCHLLARVVAELAYQCTGSDVRNLLLFVFIYEYMFVSCVNLLGGW